MKKHLFTSLLLSVLTLSAAATVWSFNYNTASTKYAMYGGDLGDPAPPSKQDSKIAFAINGNAAKAIFEAIGPDKINECEASPTTRLRTKDKGHISCSRTVKGEYSCLFGFDLKTGQSIGGSIC